MTNALVHNFLKSNGHEDVATAFKKSLKKSGTIKTIKTGKDVDTSLLEVVRKWRTLKGSPRCVVRHLMFFDFLIRVLQ